MHQVPPPPLCGRVPYPGEARITPGDLVAAMTGTKTKEISWILCRVQSYNANKKYTVIDVAPVGKSLVFHGFFF